MGGGEVVSLKNVDMPKQNKKQQNGKFQNYENPYPWGGGGGILHIT